MKLPKTGNWKIDLWQTHAIIGLYKVGVTQSAQQTHNANGFFFVDVTPNVADNMGTIVSSRWEDQPPYTGIYQVGDQYSALADGQTTAQLTVGPIFDKFGNVLQSGEVLLLPSKGQIVSQNPVNISDGYVYFTFMPSTDVGPVNIIAQSVDEQSNSILKEVNGVIYQVKPTLTVPLSPANSALTPSPRPSFLR